MWHLFTLFMLSCAINSYACQVSETGVALIKYYEGFSETAYLDTNGKWIVGYGTGGNGIGPQTKWSEKKADARLRKHAQEVAEKFCHLGLRQNQIDALTSLAYNVGVSRVFKSQIIPLLLEGQIQAAARHVRKYVRASGKILPGLILRRNTEAGLLIN